MIRLFGLVTRPAQDNAAELRRLPLAKANGKSELWKLIEDFNSHHAVTLFSFLNWFIR
jgi:hypothetical protein